MPYYRMPGIGMVHLNVGRGKRAKKSPPPCPFWRWERRDTGDGITSERVRVRCMCITTRLCDWPGCDQPMCSDHALALNDDLDVCPTHNHQRGLFSRLLPAPAKEAADA